MNRLFSMGGRMASLRKTTALALVLTMSASCAGPAPEVANVETTQLAAYTADKPPQLRPMYERVLKEGKRNEVLNNMRVGTAALDIGDTAAAGAAFDAAIIPIDTIFADNEKAKKARSIFAAEKTKDFRGEPYERAMAYYYRGLLDLMANDYENARASFKSGLIQDSMSEAEEFKQDFGSLAYLSGWASKCNGNADLAAEAFAEAASHNASLQAPPADANVLIISESGFSPQKKAEGQHRELLAYAPKVIAPEQGSRASVGTQQMTLAHGDDVYWQATTRGGRQFDFVLKGKAETKETLATVGYAFTATGAVLAQQSMYSGNQGSGYAALGFMVAGLLASAASAATKTEADTRYWDNLPGDIHLGALAIPTVPDQVTLKYTDAYGAELPALEKIVPVHKGGACSIAWGRSRSATEPMYTAMNTLR